MPRETGHSYRDPLDAVWVQALRQVGLELERTNEAYATTDGHGRLALSTQAGMDADDCVAQMVLHELCHSLVQGRDSFELPDWGLCNESERDAILERACLRVQAALLSAHGLRRTLAPTTDYRAFYDGLPSDPFEVRDASEIEEVLLARAAHARRQQRPWGPHLENALEATARLAQLLAPLLPPDHLLGTVQTAPAPHSTGLASSFAPPNHEARHCLDCTWAKARGPTGRTLTCVASGRKVSPQDLACAHFESDFACSSCGACCREAYDTVEVAARDAALRHRDYLTPRSGGYDMARREGRCAALTGGERIQERGRPSTSLPLYRPSAEPFLCLIYEDRPKSCRDFQRGSAHCLTARRAVGLSL